ncbi:hypothetical protein [Bacteroides propionicifaciens]|jgi:hypothetical protein|uniref:hypothetical protein n=1 Tax=Bacteroides propionicifaciens TaxID=392838 RepID=UPI00037CF361|nr:hypothetical protein [Bacteroides propionicifaciens]
MAARYINYILWFFGLLIVQVLLLNNVLVFGYATPYLYIYLLFFMDSSLVSRNQLMVWAFFLGLGVDIGSNTLGMNAAAAVLLAFSRPMLISMFCQVNDDANNFRPSIRNMGVAGYLKYLSLGVLIHHIALLSIEFFKISSLSMLSLRIIGSAILTTICIFAIERIRNN